MDTGPGFLVASDVAALVGPDDLETLRLSAASGYRCVVCGQADQLGTVPAAVVVMVTGASGAAPGVVLVRLAHGRCSRSRVIIKAGGISMKEQSTMTVTAAVIPYQGGRRVLLIAETAAHLSVDSGAGGRVDPVLAGLLGGGLHLLARAEEPAPEAPGWLVSLPSRNAAVISEPSGALFYSGDLPQPRAWRQLVRGRGQVELLTGVIGFGAVALADPGEGLRLLADAARRGRLVGGAVRAG